MTIPVQPPHTLDQLTTYELTRYRRELEHAEAYLDQQDPVPPARQIVHTRLAEVRAEQDSRAADR